MDSGNAACASYHYVAGASSHPTLWACIAIGALTDWFIVAVACWITDTSIRDEGWKAQLFGAVVGGLSGGLGWLMIA